MPRRSCYVGATPVFVDVEPDTWCMAVDAAEAAITERTKAIIAVDLYGGFPDLVALEKLCDHHGLALIEDSAEAAGGVHAGRPAGSFGHTSTFSFHGSKTLTTGEGGMVLSDDEALHQRMLFLRDHGRLPGDVSFRSVEVAWKYKMSELQAALGRVQLARIDELIDKKRQIFGWYADRLAGDAIALNVRTRGRAGDLLDGHRRLRRGAPGVDADTAAAALARRQHGHAPVLPAAQLAPGVRRLARQRRGPAARTQSATTWPNGRSTCRRRSRSPRTRSIGCASGSSAAG